MNTGNNKLIAEFMGLIKSTVSDKYWTEKTTLSYGTVGSGQLADLSYHSDWNSLMEVVEKIENINPNLSSFVINGNRVEIKDFSVNQSLFSGYFEEETKFKAIYKACLEFIQWYNK